MNANNTGSHRFRVPLDVSPFLETTTTATTTTTTTTPKRNVLCLVPGRGGITGQRAFKNLVVFIKT